MTFALAGTWPYTPSFCVPKSFPLCPMTPPLLPSMLLLPRLLLPPVLKLEAITHLFHHSFLFLCFFIARVLLNKEVPFFSSLQNKTLHIHHTSTRKEMMRTQAANARVCSCFLNVSVCSCFLNVSGLLTVRHHARSKNFGHGA